MTSVAIQTVQGTRALQFQGLSPRSIRASLREGSLSSDMVLFGLYADGCPSALLVAFLEPGSSNAVLRSVAVAKESRRRGYATLLIRHFELEMQQRGRTSMEANYRSEAAVPEGIQRLLRRAAWPPLIPTLLNCVTDYATLSQAPWMAERKQTVGFEYCLWSDVSVEERAVIMARQAQDSYFAYDLSPFLFEEEIEQSTSLALRREGEVVGWCIIRRIDQVTTQCASLFVEQRYQRMGWAIWLLARCIDLHRDTIMHQFLFDVKLERPAMVDFVQRRMRPYLKSVLYSSRIRKEVGALPSPVGSGSDVQRAIPSGAMACV